MPAAYSRANPKYRRLYAAKDMRRRGFKKHCERFVGNTKVLVYRRMLWKRGFKRWIEFADIYPDGTVKNRLRVQPNR
jgi:hypothetical protein